MTDPLRHLGEVPILESARDLLLTLPFPNAPDVVDAVFDPQLGQHPRPLEAIARVHQRTVAGDQLPHLQVIALQRDFAFEGGETVFAAGTDAIPYSVRLVPYHCSPTRPPRHN